MEWLKNNYEKAILSIASLALLVSCALIIARVLSFSEQFTGRNSPKPPDNAIKSLPTDALAAASKKLKSPQNWMGHDGVRAVRVRKFTLSRPLNGFLA
jgi:hypothetical protein